MPISFNQIGVISGVSGGSNVLSNPTSLQFGPDGRLYVAEQNGSINALTISLENGEYIATAHEELLLPGGGGVVKSIQNHNDDGSQNSHSNRQVTGVLVTGTAEEPVLYISSSDPRIATNGEVNLDTNSGVLTRVAWDGVAQEWVAIDLIRGLPRSEENHSNNGMVLNADGTKLYLAIGGNTNNGAPSGFFSYTAEYVLSGTVIEVDLTAIDALPTLTDPEAGQGGQARDYKYDLPTLDDPNIPNVTDGVGEDEFGMDEAGPWGGNDGLNMAVLPADAPLRIYADGFRNNYDLAMTPDGKLYTVDNGSNSNLGGDPIPENGDEDGDGIANEATNALNNGGTGAAEPLFLIQEGAYYGHPAPVRANQNQAWTVYDDNGNPDASLSVNTVADISALVPDTLQVAEGFLIDPSKFAGFEGLDPTVATDLATINARLFESGIRIPYSDTASPTIATVGSSTNGIVVYDSAGQAFNGVLDGKLFVTQFNDNVTLLNINDAGDALNPVLEEGPDGVFGTSDDVVQSGGGDGILEVANNSLGVALSNPLDVTVGPNGTLWVAEIGGNEITVLAPSDVILPGDNDSDDDGILNIDDPFVRDPSNGTAVIISPGQTYLWDFDANSDNNLPGPAGFGGGLTGIMINGITDFEEFLQAESSLEGQVINLDNVKFTTAAGGGTTVIEEVSPGEAIGAANTAEFQFHTGVQLGANVGTATIRWSIFNPAGEPEFDGPHQSIGGYIGTGDQANYLRVVAAQTSQGAAIQVLLEDSDVILYAAEIPAADLFNTAVLPATGGKIYVELFIDVIHGTATPTVSYDTTDGLVTITGFTAIDLTGSNVLAAIQGNHQVAGLDTGLAVGLSSTNNGQGALTEERFQAIFDDIEITATDAPFPPDAVDDSQSTGVNTVLVIPVADLLANDTDPNPADVVTITQVTNAVNGAVSLDDNGTPTDASDDSVLFTPNPNFEGQASFDYTISDGTATDTASVLVNVADQVVLYRVNAGGPEVAALASDPVQLAWAANSGSGTQFGDGFSVNTGNTYTASIATAGTDGSLPDYVPYQVFGGERWDDSPAPEMLWNFDVTAGGTYQVNLFLRNGWDGTNDPGERIFDIAIEGTEYFSNVDLSGTFGHQVAGMLSQTLVVEDNSLDIEFLHDVENPLINAIEIIQVGRSSSPTLAAIAIGEPSPATVVESGDVGSTTLLFPVSFGTTPTAEVTVEYSVNINGTLTTGLTQNLGTTGAEISVDIANDVLDNGSEAIAVTLTSITTGNDVATLGAKTTAEAIVTEDDQGDSFNGVAAPENDFSNDHANPDAVVLGLGVSTLVTNQKPGDNDYITFEVPLGQQLVAANLLSYVGGTNATFLGMATGDTFPSENDLINGVVPLAGGTVYDETAVGSDLLPRLTSTQVENDGTSTTGLATPLGAGFYTLWFGQNGEPASGSTLAFVTEALLPPNAVDDDTTTAINTILNIPVADLLVNDTDSNASDTLTVTQVANAVNGTVSLSDNGTPDNADDDFVLFTPAADFVGQANFDYTVSDGTATDTAAVTVAVTDPAVPVVLYRVNAGGAEVAALASDPVQLAWAANSGSGAQFGDGFSVNTGNTYTASIATAGTDGSLPDYVPYQVFGGERWDDSPAPEMLWNFDVTAGGTYQVNLFLRNGWDGTNDPGERIFDIAIEGTEYFSNVDLSGTFGHQVAGMLSQTLVVEDNSLDIEFLHDVENPLINAIEIIQIDGETKPTVSILNTSSTVSEGISGGQIQISLATNFTVPADEIVDITFQIEPISATPGVGGDYEYVSTSATFGGGTYTDTVSIAGSSSDVTIPINILNDLELESSEAFQVTLVSVSANAQLDPANSVATVAIADDDVAKEVSITAAQNAAEPATNGQFTVNLSAAATTDTTVAYMVTGTATPDSDYTALTGSVTIPQGELSASMNINVLNDLDVEGSEDVTVTLESITNGDADIIVGAADTATVAIADDESVGAATLSINLSSNNIQISNFGNNSFLFTNTGDKDITQLEIDVTNALYPDSVFDPEGVAGDTVAKGLQINTNGGTGVDSPSSDSYIGVGGIAGYEGIKLTFDPTVNNGFNPGEQVGFSVDMDPNSIAGAQKATLDNGTDPFWDVGGVSGAELIGSTFTVTFADGTTATGQLQGVGNNGGSQGLASQNSPNLNVSLAVNGLNGGGVGTYGADNLPNVIINGPAGETARVVLTKGFMQPVVNLFSDPYKTQLDNQLGALLATNFPANNAVEFQTVDIVLTGEAQDISSLFDFSGVSAYNFIKDADEAVWSFDEDKVPLGFVASIIDPTNSDLPKGDVTDPIYLEYAEVPTVSVVTTQNGDEAGPTDGAFTVNLNQALATDTVVSYTVSGTATPDVDYTPLSGGVTIAAGQTSALIPVAVLSDTDIEGEESVVVTLDAIVNGEPDIIVGTANQATVAIADAVNEATVTATQDAAEPATNGQFTVSLTQAAATDTTIAYSVSGTATPDSDYTALTGAVVIPAGSLSAPIDIAVIEDPEEEGSEAVTVTLETVTAGDADVVVSTTSQTATVDIADDDLASQVLYRVNAGGAEVAAVDGGIAWSADTETQNSDYLLDPGSNDSAAFTVQIDPTMDPLIAATTPAGIYQTERWDNAGGSSMQWAFAVPEAGNYEVRLFVGNGWSGTNDPGERVFDVAIEGTVLSNLNDIDLSAQFGHQAGGVITNQINVIDGELNIEFLHQVENPLINGIEILQV